ncbi:hypothetical protein N7499_002070 [Penicillium canescens]|uniref:SAC3/GANP/THP3 conserved domain-containing protein n=1 Tax=Penicillium canescens TaxID=5083 RepID=A0AAD6N6A3_PENCN|nr:uncharacterized protein N7446_009609 [Penicillium canescens]KAJ6034853.1 hypothetical protein N7460_009028 [Penicillium canescens]KAJ6053597.1 hypothetical protein N7446_009609 [Penicillium canescens]KAJ6097696.1 hypothetical protein N7499_002070 [Penicillium canescens]KAJ6165685.1 hypothetical protein N7485_008929 [Penicillium canescens]
MAGPFNPFGGAVSNGQRGGRGAQGSAGRGRGGSSGLAAAQFQGNNARGDGKDRGRGRGRGQSQYRGRGRGRGAGAASHTVNGTQQATAGDPGATTSPFARSNQQNSSVASPFGLQPVQQSPFSALQKASPASNLSNNPFAKPAQNMNHQGSVAFSRIGSGGPVENASSGNYQDRYDKLKLDRAKERQRAIKDGQMADPNQPTSLKQAITPVGTCTSMCPEFERVERIVQKMMDKCEKYLDPATNQLEIMESKMLKRFRRSAAGYDEQLPSDIRTPKTLLQSMNYLIRYVVGGSEPLAIIHKFVWDRTRSIRNDFSVQQLTQEEDVKMAVMCLERIARFHIVSLHLLSNPTNEEQFDRHQEREQLNNTMLSLMYYYDDNRGRIVFPREDEFRAYYILFSIHDQRPDLEARVQKWPADLLASPRVQVALDLFAAAGNTWEYQGALDARRPNAIAQGFYTRFFNIINSPSVPYLMACVAEVYFNHIRQTAIRAIWKAYCRSPVSQQAKNEEWTVEELTRVLHFDDYEQTIRFCEEQDLQLAQHADGALYLNWGSRPVDSIGFSPSSDHSYSETYVESKRAGRSLVAVILGMTIPEAARMGMLDRSLLAKQKDRASDLSDDSKSLFVSDDENQTPAPVIEPNGFVDNTSASDLRTASEGAQFPPVAPSPFQSPFPPPATQSSNPFAQASTSAAPSPFSFSQSAEPAQNVEAPAVTTSVSPFSFSKPVETPVANTVSPSPLGGSSNPFSFAKPAETGQKTEAPAALSPFATSSSPFSFAKPAEKTDVPAATPAAPSPFAPSSSIFSFPKPAKVDQKADAGTAATPTTSSPFKASSSSETTAPKNPFASLSSGASLPSSQPNPFAASLSAVKPPDTTQTTETPAVTAAAPSSIFKPSTFPPASSTPDFSFLKPSSSLPPSTAAPTAAAPFTFTKALEASQAETPVATSTSVPASIFATSNTPEQSSTAFNNPFASLTPKTSISSSGPGTVAPSAAPSAFSQPSEPSEKAKEPVTASTTAKPQFSFSAGSTNAVPGVSNEVDSSFATPAPQPNGKVDSSATVSSTPPTSPPPVPGSLPSTSPKTRDTQPAKMRSLAWEQCPTPEQVLSSLFNYTGTLASSPHAKSSSPSQSLSSQSGQASKLFDAKSSMYNPLTNPTESSKPLFQGSIASGSSVQQASLKRPHDDDTTKQRRRSSLKRQSTSASSGNPLKRSVHFEAPPTQQPQEMQMSLSELSQLDAREPKANVSQKRSRSKTTSAHKKRSLDESTETKSNNGPSPKLAKVSDLPTSEEPLYPRFSLSKVLSEPMPKLPILERLERKLAETKALVEPKPLTDQEKKWLEEQKRIRERQVQEDEILLSRARILAHELKNGPGIFDIPKDIPYSPPVDPPINHRRAALLEKSSPHGYTLNYGPDTPGLASFAPSRSAHSTHPRVEARFRRTASQGSSSISLGIERYRRERDQRAEAERKRKEEEKQKAKKGEKLKKEKENQRLVSVEDDDDVVCLD